MIFLALDYIVFGKENCWIFLILLLEKNGLLGTPVTECVIVRQRAKKSADGYEAIRLLMVLSTTAWVEMLERWYAMPEASRIHMPMVCNLNSLELRCMGKLVQEEHKYSTTPLMDRCCAMCGQMLASSTQFQKGNKWNGKRGTPCQVRGTTVTWDSMPPFLFCLLYTSPSPRD